MWARVKLAAFAAGVILITSGSYAREIAPKPAPAEPQVRFAPIPATAWTGLAVLGGIIIIRAIRRRNA